MDMGRWGPMIFRIAPGKITGLSDLATSYTLKSDSNEDANGKASTNKRGMELQPVSFSVPYLRAAGVDPRARMEEWGKLVGQSHPFYLNEQRFGPARLLLTSVGVSEVVTNNEGVILSLKIAVSLEEDNSTTKQTTTPAVTPAATTATSAKPNASKAQALNATAPKSYKETLKPYSHSNMVAAAAARRGKK